ncbi:hypothetical protein LLE49_25865 [Alicyclobacillus tolerans]|uniref:hypothetical protein n=1 Tax=Alicyclobacillus tolerans TaxID=90970 RepID=UPI001F254FFB|nr:hypothetical protein [Alicyclobacillus tolerans]MCF8568156.1 hypothetical protein [Alicyclobacillus tolerans]
MNGGEGKRKIRSEKKIHVNPALDSDTHHKLKRLALACDTTKTSLAAELLRIALNTPSLVNWLQDQYGADEFRVIPMKDQGRVTY